jgi:hypothetical protein
LLFDVATIVFLVLTSFIDGSPVLELVDAAIAIIILAHFIARLLLSRHRFHDLLCQRRRENASAGRSKTASGWMPKAPTGS